MSNGVTVNLGPLNEIIAATKDSNSTFWGKIRKKWTVRYLSFVKERFDIFSKGGGDWDALAASTIKRRRKGKGKSKTKSSLMRLSSGGLGSAGGSFAILADTGTLKAAIDPHIANPDGSLREAIPYGVRVGYGGGTKHPNSKLSIDAIASYHQEGNGNLPQRKIIVDPTQNVLQAMMDDVTKAVDEELRN